MKRVQRFDFGELAKAKKLDNGWLRLEGRSARVGPLQYPQEDGRIMTELVLPEELFDPASVESAHMVPLTNTHPDGMLTAATARAHQVGQVGQDLRADGDYLVAPMMITDGSAVAAVEGGRQELSWGYECDVDPPDPALVGKWGPHDGIQRRRRYNHLAIVDAARAGSGARVRLDASGNARLTFAPPAETVVPVVATQQSPESPSMPQTIRIDGAVFTVDDANAPGIQAAISAAVERVRAELQGKLDGANAALATEKTRADKADGLLSTLRSNVGKNWLRLRGRFDAMKARMMPCDGCGGLGKMDGAKCDWCDGLGKVRMHDAINAEPIAEMVAEDAEKAMLGAPDGDGDNDYEEHTDIPPHVLEAQHKDAAHPLAKLYRAATAIRRKRLDAITARVKRDTAARVALETGARKWLGADAKLDGKSEVEVQSMVIAKLTPALKLDGKSPEQIAVAYEMAIAAAPNPGASNDIRDNAGANNGGGNNPAPHADGDAFDVGKAQKAYLDNLAKAAKGGRPAA